MAFLKSNISKRRVLGTKLLKNTNRKPYTIYRIVPLSMTLRTSDPDLKVTTFLKWNIVKSARNKDKVTILHNRKLYLTYGMVLCLVILTDL